MESLPTRRVRSLGYTDLSVAEAAAYILDAAEREEPLAVFTPGATVAAAAERDTSLPALLSHADLLLPDGVGCRLAARLSGVGRMRVAPGIEVAEALLPLAAKRGMRIFLYGGREGIALRAAERLGEKYPTLTFGSADGYGEDPIDAILRFRPHLLFVCLGFPKQEAWIVSHRHRFSFPALALGGTLDVFSGRLRRAPLPFRSMGLEWLWRTLREPRRVVRLLPLPRYFCGCAREGMRRFLQNFQKKREKSPRSRKM